jgi:hypothetical protein
MIAKLKPSRGILIYALSVFSGALVYVANRKIGFAPIWVEGILIVAIIVFFELIRKSKTPGI